MSLPDQSEPIILYKCPDCGITWDAQPRHCIPRPNPVRHPDWCYFGPESLARQRSADRVLKEMLDKKEKSRAEVNLKGQAIREALIKFGWTPPAVEDHEIIPLSVQMAREWNPQ